MIIAHRGVHNNESIPENSIRAFKEAIFKGYAIEFDIEITKDDVLVIHHDDSLVRMTGLNKNVEDMTYEEIKELKLLNTEETIPTFREVLDLVQGKALLDIEIKSTKRKNKVISLVLKELENYQGKVLLKSFDPFIVRKLKRKTKYPVGLLVMEKSASKGLNFLVRSKLIYLTPFDFIAVDKRMLNKRIYKKYKKKCPLYIWSFKGLIEADVYLKEYPDIMCICNDLY